MSRIRSVKPGLFTTPDWAGVDIEARFLFVGLWTEADDDGRFLDSPKRLAGALFPHDEEVTADKVEKWLDQLAHSWKILRYSSGSGRYAQVVKWFRHQKVSHRLPSAFPPPSAAVLEQFTSCSGIPPDVFFPEVEGEVEGEKEFARRQGFEADFDVAWSLYPRKVARAEALRAYIARRREGIEATSLLTAARHYAQAKKGCEAKFILHGGTFYGPNERWKEYLDPSSAKPESADTVPAEQSAIHRRLITEEP